MNYLSVCALFREEDSYLKEWIEYYRLIGTEHFYLICNEADPIVPERILKPYIDSGLVTLFNTRDMIVGGGYDQWIHPVVFNWFVMYLRGKTEWAAMIDLDEFILPKKTDDLKVFLQDYEKPNINAVAVHWKMFGSNGFVTQPQSQIRQLLRRAPDDFYRNNTIKSIIRPSKVKGCQNSHFFSVRLL